MTDKARARDLASPKDAFDGHHAEWHAYTQSPLGRLREGLVLHHLREALSSRPGPLRVLDAGGGSGGYAIPLAAEGHRVVLVDFSPEMLALARAAGEETQLPSGQIDFQLLDLQKLQAEFAPGDFDLVLCHTVLEYVARPLDLLSALCLLLADGGLISVLVTNPHSEALKWALRKQDLQQASQALRDPVSPADLFGLPRCIVPRDGVRQTLLDAGLAPSVERGIRVFADYMPSDRLSDRAFFQLLFELELEAGARDPFRQIARYTHVLARKGVRQAT